MAKTIDKCRKDSTRYRSRSRLNFATYSTYVWTVPARCRRRRLSAVRAADRRRRADGVVADGKRGLVILGVENPTGAGRGDRDSRRRGCRCGSGRRRSCGRGRRGCRGRSRRRGGVLHCFRQGMFPTYIAVVADIGAVAVVRCNTAAAAAFAYHIHEELGPGEPADLRGAEGLMETRKRLL